ncbi:MAG: DUF1887 family protein [Clostridia bacterium]|nr:DUF1887 family protein [Clostridia bacterium]
MSNELEYKLFERIAVALEGILEELKKRNSVDDEELFKSIELPSDLDWLEEKDAVTLNIQEFLKQKGYDVFYCTFIEDIDPTMLMIANSIGKSYDLVSPFILEIKRNIDKPSQFALRVKKYTQRSACAICTLATLLKEHKLLRYYSYKKTPECLVIAKPENTGNIHNFYTGQWLEYYVANVVNNVLKSREGYKSVNLNIKVKNRNCVEFEFDVMAILNDEIFWVECKTGEYNKHLPKYEKLARELGIPSNRMFLVVAGIDDETANSLSNAHDITVCSVDKFKSIFEKSLET